MDSVRLRRILLAGTGILAALCVAALLLPRQETPADEPPRTEAQASAPNQDTPPDDAEETPAAMYLLGVWQGNVAVLEPKERLPMRVTETPVSSLPRPDQQALEQGIPVYNAEELAALLEDYGS